MRDLAGQSFSSDKKKKPILKLIIVVVLICGAFYVLTNFLKLGSSAGGSSVKLSEAPRGLKPVTANGAADITQGGVELKTQSIKLKLAKGDFSGSATASRSFGGGTYVLSVDATLQDPVGQSYAVWLVGDGGAVLVDYMKGVKNSWNLSVRTSDKYSNLNEIWITLERVKDNKPEEHLLEGSF